MIAEFSDLPDVEQVSRIILRLLLAAILGGIPGFEREQKGKAPGLRTHILEALGAALFVIVPQQAGLSSADLSCALQGFVAGVGFWAPEPSSRGTAMKRSGTDYSRRHLAN